MRNDHVANDQGNGVAGDPGSREPRFALATLGGALRDALQTVRLEHPEVDRSLGRLSGLERVAEVLRYQILRLEYALSPAGGLRAWVKVNLLLGAVLAVPLLVLVPLVTAFLGAFTTWTRFLFDASVNILYMACAVAATVTVAAALHFGIKRYAEHNRRRDTRNGRR